ncbi:MAG: AMP-binding protein [Variibacter sp.]|nr:AMP-binding protein [Variibacter sp.]
MPLARPLSGALDVAPAREPGYEAWTLPRLVEDRAASLPDAPLLISGGDIWSGADLNREANRVARTLVRNGLQPGGRCAVMMTTSPAYIATWIGIAKAGGVEVPLNTAYRGDILRHVLTTAQVTIIVADAAFLPVIAEILPNCPTVQRCVLRGGAPADRARVPIPCVDFDASLVQDGSNLGVPVHFADPACIMFTSGTTGLSKGAVISHHQEVSFGATFREIVGMQADDVPYNYLPFFHIAGKFVFMGALLAGARMLLRERFSLSDFWPDVHRHGCTMCVSVGGVCNMLYGLPERPDDAKNPLRILYAVPIPHEIKPRFEHRFGVTLVEGYGSTESNIVSWTPPEGAPHGSCGRTSPWYDVSVVDEHDRELPAGQAGEIVVRGRGPSLLMQGYFGMPDKTLEVFRNQWFHTGDRGRFDDQGWLYFIDRIKDAIRRHGENISSYEVEQTVLRHPAVAEAAAVGIASELLEEDLKLVVVRRSQAALTELELLRWCVEQMPYFMVPRYIEFRTELPRTPTQKIRKVELREAGRDAPGIWDCEQHGFRVTRNGLTPLQK